MIYRVVHATRYVYSEPVSFCHNLAILMPRNLPHQVCLNSRITVDPPPVAYRERTDFFGNRVCYFAIQQPHDHLSVTATSEVRTTPEEQKRDFSSSLTWEQVVAHMSAQGSPETLYARQFAIESPLVAPFPEIKDYAADSFAAGRPMLEAVRHLMQRIHRDFNFVPGFTTIATPLVDVLKHRRGVCQDFAHLAIGCLRALGLPARYVSGYIETLPPPGQEKLTGADASHAWFSTYAPDVGWRDFDPTNNLLPSDQHIIVAYGRDYSDVTPLKGVIFTSGKHELTVAVDVERRE